MSTLKNCDPDLKKYILKHRLEGIFESLISALAVNRPADSKGFIIEKLKALITDNKLLRTLQWDTFIDEDKKPVNPFGSMFDLWGYDYNGYMQPSSEMYEKAYDFYNRRLMNTCFSGLKNYWRYKIAKKAELARRILFAGSFYNKRLTEKHFSAILVYTRAMKEKEKIFMKTIRDIYNCSLLRMIFKAWNGVSMDAKQTREYFEKLERGEMPEGPEITSDGEDHISNFPRKVAIMIFSYVDLPDLITCSQVCRTWKMIAQSSSLWSRIDLTKLKKRISNKGVASLIHKCRPFLCHLNLRGLEYLSSKSLKTIGECRNLQDLNLSKCKGVTFDVIKEITLGCASLLYLNVSHCYISDAALKALSRNCNNIYFLNLSFCTDFTNHGLHYIASGKGCQKLLYLDLSGCEQITEEGFADLAKGCNRLATLTLDHLPSLRDAHIKAFILGCKTLRCISFMHSPLLTDHAIKNLCLSKRLQVIKLEGNNRITDGAIRGLVKSCPDLHYVHLVDCERLTDLSLKSLNQCKHLTVLNVADCIRFSDTGMRYVIEGPSGTKIRELNLTNCLRVSDVSVLRIAQRCFSLTYVNFSYCEHVTDAGVELLGTIVSLISVDLSGCLVQDQGISALGNNPRLRDITISGCSSVTDIGIQKFVQQTKDLESCDVSDCHLLTDHAIKSMAFCCRRLRRLNISGCKLLTDQSVKYLSGVCHYVDTLDISGCNLITDKALKFFKKGCRNIQYLFMRNCRGISQVMALKIQGKIPVVVHGFDDNPPSFSTIVPLKSFDSLDTVK